MRDAVRRHPLLFFFAFAFPLSWYPWLIALAQGRTTGPNPLGPFVAALIVGALIAGKRGALDILRKIVQWRVGVVPFVVAFGLPVLFCAITFAIASTLARDPIQITAIRWQDVVEQFLFIFLFIGLGEEPGWRGFALPELLRKRGPVAATLILSAVWAVWHLPLIGNEFPLPRVPAFLLGLLGASFVQTWLHRRANGSVLVQMVLHAMVNTAGAGVMFRWFSAHDQATVWWINAFVWLAAGAIAAAVPNESARAASIQLEPERS